MYKYKLKDQFLIRFSHFFLGHIFVNAMILGPNVHDVSLEHQLRFDMTDEDLISPPEVLYATFSIMFYFSTLFPYIYSKSYASLFSSCSPDIFNSSLVFFLCLAASNSYYFCSSHKSFIRCYCSFICFIVSLFSTGIASSFWSCFF